MKITCGAFTGPSRVRLPYRLTHLFVLAALTLTTAAVILSCSSPGGLMGNMALATAPAKRASPATQEGAVHAKEHFWHAFQSGAYDDRANLLTDLTAAYLDHPFDAELTLLIAHTHLWSVSERERVPTGKLSPLVTDDLALAAFYFDQAALLAPADRRIPGWLGSVEMALGTIHHDQRFIRAGYYRARDAWHAYPEFNAFTFAYALSPADPASDEFKEARDAIWDSARTCSGSKVDPAHPSVAAGNIAAITAHDPICANTAKAPHNWEGFWWTAAQLESQSGNTAVARTCFTNARLSPAFGQWPYRQQFEVDEAEVESLARTLRESPSRVLVNSAMSCMVCHQNGETMRR